MKTSTGTTIWVPGREAGEGWLPGGHMIGRVGKGIPRRTRKERRKKKEKAQ